MVRYTCGQKETSVKCIQYFPVQIVFWHSLQKSKIITEVKAGEKTCKEILLLSIQIQNIYVHSSVRWINMTKKGKEDVYTSKYLTEELILFRDGATLWTQQHISFLFINPTAQ